MPLFNGCGSVLEGKLQKVAALGCDCRYFTHRGNLCGSHK